MRIKRILERFGPSDIYVGSSDASLRKVVKPYRSFDPGNGSAILYHASIGSPVAHYLLKIRSPLIVDYHNVTPMRFFARYEPRIAAQLYAGRVECARLAAKASLGLADSEYSAAELETMGYAKAIAVPILIDFSRYEDEPDQRVVRDLAATKRGTDVLFVGRISPQKRQEDLIKAFAVYKRYFDPGSRLLLVGSPASSRYRDSLGSFVRRLGLDDVVFTGKVSFPALLAYYRSADVFLSLSEHEGFCVPLLEAMAQDLPVIAFAAAAVPETLGDAGILFHEKNYGDLAALVDVVHNNGDMRARLITAGRSRIDRYRPEPHEERLAELLESVL